MAIFIGAVLATSAAVPALVTATGERASMRFLDLFAAHILTEYTHTTS